MKKLIFLIVGLTILINVNAQVLDSLRHADYLKYVEYMEKAGSVPTTEETWNKIFGDNYKHLNMYPTSPGTYLVKAKNQIIAGITIQMLTAISETTVFLTAKDLTPKQMYTISAVGGALSALGLVLEISGVVNIGKAGISLNENGIGIKVKF